MKRFIKGGAFAAAAIMLNLGAAADVSETDVSSIVDAKPTAFQEAMLKTADAGMVSLPEMSQFERNFLQSQSDRTQSYKLSANLLHDNFCRDVAIENCEFLTTGHPGFNAMYQACFEYHRDTCLEELRSPGEEIGGQ